MVARDGVPSYSIIVPTSEKEGRSMIDLLHDASKGAADIQATQNLVGGSMPIPTSRTIK
jgi:hypothetical protein